MKRNLKKLGFAPELLAHLANGIFRVVDNAVPDDAEVVGAGYDEMRHQLFIVLRHDSFPPVPLEEELPYHWPPTIEPIEVHG